MLQMGMAGEASSPSLIGAGKKQHWRHVFWCGLFQVTIMPKRYSGKYVNDEKCQLFVYVLQK